MKTAGTKELRAEVLAKIGMTRMFEGTDGTEGCKR
jgi:hypothetical protein